MENHIVEQLIEKIKHLEMELRHELQKKQEEFFYRIDRKKVRFEKEAKKQHRKLKKKLRYFLLESPLLHYLIAPIIWSVTFPALLLDLFVSTYQFICFPVYKIPKVKRSRYIIIDRHALSYLNIIEKINCVYCGYFNGLMAYTQEIASRTEQYWCPIKHARRIGYTHSRYKYFFDYGNGEGYREKVEEVRRAFDDLANEDKGEKADK